MEENKQSILKNISDKIMKNEIALIGIYFGNSDLFLHDDLGVNFFTAEVTKMYYSAGLEMATGGIKEFSEFAVDKHFENNYLQNLTYKNLGGYEQLSNAVKVATKNKEEQNREAYVTELKKIKVLNQLYVRGFINVNKVQEYMQYDINTIEGIYEAEISNIFISAETSEDIVVDIAEGVDALYDEWNEGIAEGLPYYNQPILTQETRGALEGEITLLGGLSGVGKSSFLRNAVLPSLLHYEEKAVIMINEEDYKKWQMEIVLFAVNNILAKELNIKIGLKKWELKNGHYNEKVGSYVKWGLDWLASKKSLVKIVQFKSFNTDNAVRRIKKYSALGIKNFILDTFKADTHYTTSEWINIKQNMIKLHDTIKSCNKNVRLWVTVQLAKGNSDKEMYYTQSNIAGAKDMINEVATCLMFRHLYDTELGTLDVRDKNNIKVILDKDKKYQLCFVVKNRNGNSDIQIVYEHDLGKNILVEKGRTRVTKTF